MKCRILKRIGLWLFISAFVLNVVVTSYASSLVKTYNTGVVEGVGAALAGGGPFFGLVGAALLAAGLVCEAASDDPIDGAVEYFVHNCIVNDHFAGTALEYIYENLEIDENGNINYKQVVDNINAYVEAGNISISTGKAVTFENGVLRVAPEIISSMAKDFRSWWTGSISNKYGLKTYIDALGNFGLTYGWKSDIPVDSDLYRTYMLIVPSAENNSSSLHNSYFLLTSLGDVPLNVYGYDDISPKYMLYYERENWQPTYYTWNVQEEYRETLIYTTHSRNAAFEPCVNFYDENGSLLKTVVEYGKSFYINSCNAVSWYGGSLYNLGAIIGMSDSIPDSNRIYIGADAPEAPPVSNIYDGLAEDILNVPVTDFPVGSDGTIAIDNGMVNDLEKAFENVIGVAEGIGDNATDEEKKQAISDSIAGEIDNVIENTQERVEAQNPSVPSNPSVGYPEVGDLKTDGLIDKFPFCIPFDLISLIKAFEAEPEAPYIEIPFVVPVIGASDNIVIDLSKYEYIGAILRSLEVVGFLLFLILKTRDLIKG